jgi:hypothetical protein
VFAHSWELQGAADIHWNDASLGVYTVFNDEQIQCTPRGVNAVGGVGEQNATAAYGQALFTDVRSGHRQPITSRALCQAALRRFIPGPPDLPFG